MTKLSDMTFEQKARLKEAENLTRFETHCILSGIVPTDQMRELVKAGCRQWYESHEETLFIPSSVLRTFIDLKLVQEAQSEPSEVLASEAGPAILTTLPH